MSRWAVAAVEAGRAGDLHLDRLTAIVSALGGYLSVRILYQGEGLDRLRDRRHAGLVESVLRRLIDEGWEVATEVSFNVFGERGVIDILAYHRATGTLLVVEVKTVVPDIGGLLATLDRKVRLAPQIAHERGWPVRHVARLLVLPEASTARRRIDGHIHQRLSGTGLGGQSVAASPDRSSVWPDLLVNRSWWQHATRSRVGSQLSRRQATLDSRFVPVTCLQRRVGDGRKVRLWPLGQADDRTRRAEGRRLVSCAPRTRSGRSGPKVA